MLRRLDLKKSYRSLTTGFWPVDVPLGGRTIIYGHNGSGKSTLSDLLLEMAEGASPVEVIWEDETSQAHKVAVDAPCPSPSMAVFTRTWVTKNLSEFLDGKGASAIVTLGKEAIDAKEEEARLAREIEAWDKEVSDSKTQESQLARKVEGIARQVQDSISSELQSFDYKRFSKNRWSVPTVKTKLTEYKGDYPDQADHAEALKRLGEGEMDPLPAVAAPPANFAPLVSRLTDVLAETPSRVALSELSEHPEAQTWVEHGTRLHEHVGACLFCGGRITPERLHELARHFDESWQDIRNLSDGLARDIATAHGSLARWVADLPNANALAGHLRVSYSDQVSTVTADVAGRLSILQQLEDIVRAKSEDPSLVPELPDLSLLDEPLRTAALIGAVSEHNSEAGAHAEVSEKSVITILDHLIGSQADSFRELEAQRNASTKRSADATEACRLAQRALDEARQKQFSSSEMAAKLTDDLARVYGKRHLSVSVTADGKSYSCMRGEQAADHLSDGERTTLSLLYFLRKLQDETERSDPQRRIVVIDDPSSSLDREALFATHQWLIDTLASFGQYVVLTHDFSLLRLFVKSQNNRWTTSLKSLSKGDTAEATFPGVAFLEMFASTSGDERTTKIAKLPSMLKNNISEYAYLFSMVMTGVSDGTDSERLFLLPNAARRILEVFCTYKSPHLPNFDAQLKSLIAEESAPEAYRDVYDFCNRYSHGEGSESVDVLDARTVHLQIRRCMEFLKQVDSEHFERMCKATSIDPQIVG
ncbi:MAG: AAA family ATPase [Microbacterium sp.]|uniref:AAA family ATPase n=1 Tax=Microbacterium sp. TaxID=51671 RepID=UPI0027276D36|nr:AAA family ATPase [Microbacterium sp.]MDO8383361.1 AAA family ATPase [Microbacterium sp.]